MAVFRLAFGGRLYGDIWTSSLHLNGEISGPVLGTSALDDVTADVQKWFLGINATAGSTLDWVKLNEIDPVTRAYKSQTDTQEKRLMPAVVGDGGGLPPAQLTMCVSLLTDAKRGMASRGRFYPPPTSAVGTVDVQTGQISKSTLDPMLDASAQLIRDLNNWPSIDGAGATVVVLGSNGSMRNVQAIAIGSVPDTQRRRRNALKETYHTIDVS